MTNKTLAIPAKFESIFTPNSEPEYDELGRLVKAGHKRKRFYLRYGGRASGKSHAFATAAVLRAYMGFERILCAREIQNTISQSVHRLLCDKIKELGLADFFTITDSEIRVPHNGSTFTFRGLGNNVEETVKSIEKITITYCEESQAISEHSWSVLLPSVLRAPTSEVWVAWNPSTYEDAVWKRFVEDFDPKRMDLEKVNYYDNPFIPEGITEQIEADKKRDYESFSNVWLGEPRTARDGGIFTPEKIKIIETRPAGLTLCRGWDLAGSAVIEKKNGTYTDPDFTVGALIGADHSTGQYYILDIVRLRGTPDVVEAAILNTAALDGQEVMQSIAQEPGQAGIMQAQYYARRLAGYRLHTSPETGSKAVRADPLAAQVNVGNCSMVRAPWNQVLIDEMRAFNGEKNGPHDDIVDACSRAMSHLMQPRYIQKVRVF